MASTSGEGSPFDYDFSLDKACQLPYFDPDKVAEQAVWPAVNHLWRGDWRKDAYAGHQFVFPGRGAGLHESTVFDVALITDCYSLPAEEDDDNDSIELGHATTIQIEKVVTAGLREIVFQHAHKAEAELMETFQDPQILVAKTGITYEFDTIEDAEINAFQSVEYSDGIVIWVSDRIDEHEVGEFYENDEEVDDLVFDIDRFHQVDLENIATALSILGAPEYCIRALDTIKGQPLEIE
ncbi:MAG TPA: hypothetical protein VFH99_00570 [Candidatus Saccharimonadales bacterium]|nr:hypothetical protein [Candidatus Saccharimonadales bacterium]